MRACIKPKKGVTALPHHTMKNKKSICQHDYHPQSLRTNHLSPNPPASNQVIKCKYPEQRSPPPRSTLLTHLFRSREGRNPSVFQVFSSSNFAQHAKISRESSLKNSSCIFKTVTNSTTHSLETITRENRQSPTGRTGNIVTQNLVIRIVHFRNFPAVFLTLVLYIS